MVGIRAEAAVGGDLVENVEGRAGDRQRGDIVIVDAGYGPVIDVEIKRAVRVDGARRLVARYIRHETEGRAARRRVSEVRGGERNLLNVPVAGRGADKSAEVGGAACRRGDIRVDGHAVDGDVRGVPVGAEDRAEAAVLRSAVVDVDVHRHVTEGNLTIVLDVSAVGDARDRGSENGRAVGAAGLVIIQPQSRIREAHGLGGRRGCFVSRRNVSDRAAHEEARVAARI